MAIMIYLKLRMQTHGRTAAGPHKGGGGDKLGHELALGPIGSGHGGVSQ